MHEENPSSIHLTVILFDVPAYHTPLYHDASGSITCTPGEAIVKRGILAGSLILFAAAFALCQQKAPAANSVLVERVGDVGFIQVQAESFKSLTPEQQSLAYWLTQASIAIDPIIYDQLSAYGLRQKRLLEGILANREVTDPVALTKITEFAKLFWANRGNHNEYTAQKFLPTFTFAQLQEATLRVQGIGAFHTAYGDLPPLASAADASREVEALRAAFFDADFEPMATAKSPTGGKDTIQSSSNTFYPGLSLADLKDFHEKYALNSRVVKGADGKLQELVYRAGTPDGKVPSGLYAVYLKKAVECLEKARGYADPKQAKVIADLSRFYQTGEFADWLQFGTDWVQNDATVDFDNGFIEVYRDARGAKGSSQSFVTITDKPVTDVMVKLAQNADYFEQKAPWDAKYKRQTFHPPVVKAVETLIETGDFAVSVIGDNLPNENEIHEKYGTKNFLFTGSSRALNEAAGTRSSGEFAASPEIAARHVRYGAEADDLMTALHEVIGHGSGKLSDRIKSGAEPYLKEYFSTLEEARADLMALWNAWDPKLKELNLISNQDEIAKAMYDDAVIAPLTQLRRIPRGDSIEEDHQRDRQLIVRYIEDKVPGSVEQFTREGKTYIRVADYPKMHQGVGILLAELMRCKAEGDYDAIKALVDKYGVHFDPALRDQMVSRFRALNLPTYWAGINSELSVQVTPANSGGTVTITEIRYPRDVVYQYLSYGAMFDASLAAKVSSTTAHRP
jgi:dipeptidyl-peptidase-3